MAIDLNKWAPWNWFRKEQEEQQPPPFVAGTAQ